MLEAELEARRGALARHPVLARLAERLERLAGRLGIDPVYLPDAKALLSQDGGICSNDGARLAFNPYQPHRHRCERCGNWYEGDRHHRAWITRYHIWLSERVVHLALLAALYGRADLADRAAAILDAYAARYRDYPNRDNVLGPTRLFFSTYLESIWLTQMAIAARLLDVAMPAALSSDLRRALRSTVEESAQLIASFDEGWSNRQVWNMTALAAAGLWLKRDDVVAGSAHRLAVLQDAVGDDGLWHEGENYHLFALGGFLLGAEILRWTGRDLYRETPLGSMYAAPLDTLLPDLTLPARGDAPYGVSVCQPRFAELWELGRARTNDPRLDAILARLYQTGPELEDGGVVELAEQEWNRPAHRQHRERLGWKALTWMLPDPPEGAATAASSVLLESRGVALLRNGNDRAVLVECGRRHGGHAHPDRLHLSVYWRGARFADFGTGTYVRPSLHWYRSALAHNAPTQSGAGQSPVVAACDAFAAEGHWQWCRTTAEALLGPGTRVQRSVFVGPDLLIDVVRLDAPPELTVDLPLHPLDGVTAPVVATDPRPAPLTDAGHETGYDRAEIIGQVEPGAAMALGDSGLTLTLAPRDGETVLVARAPGPPGADLADGTPLSFLIRRAAGPGRWVHCIAPSGAVSRIAQDGPDLVVELHGRAIRIIEGADGAVLQEPGMAPARLAARGAMAWPEPAAAPVPEPTVFRVPVAAHEPTLERWPATALTFVLGAEHYRRSELPYEGHDSFGALVEVVAWETALCFRFRVTKPQLAIRPPDAADPALDNEPADIHSDGVQCYVGRRRWSGYLVVPELQSRSVRVRPVRGTGARSADVRGESRATADGYEVVVRCDTGAPLLRGERVRFSAVVNEMRPDRERRAGQLALSGGGWVYLRGDREPAGSAFVAEIA